MCQVLFWALWVEKWTKQTKTSGHTDLVFYWGETNTEQNMQVICALGRKIKQGREKNRVSEEWVWVAILNRLFKEVLTETVHCSKSWKEGREGATRMSGFQHSRKKRQQVQISRGWSLPGVFEKQLGSQWACCEWTRGRVEKREETSPEHVSHCKAFGSCWLK